MKRFMATFCVMSFFLLVTVGFANAQDIGNKFGIGTSATYYFPQDDDLLGTSVDLDDDIGGGLNFTYIVVPRFALELAWNYFKTDIKHGGLEVGEITIQPLLLTCWFRILPEGPVVPYIGGGVGYYFIEFDISSEAKEEAKARGAALAEDVDDSLGLHASAGLDWFITDNFAINLETRYFWTEADVQGKEGSTTVNGDIDLAALVIGSGIKLYF
jgi:outer membrane protein